MDLFPVRSGGVVAPGRVLRQSTKRTPAMRPPAKADLVGYDVTHLVDGVKYRKSGGACPRLVGIKRLSALRK
jgi:hypothetical protein